MIGLIERSRPSLIYVSLAAGLAAVFVPMGLLRFVDADEGTYLLVSRLVAEGYVPYHDFFYPQMYLLPYVYGFWMKLVGYSWYGARLLSALFCIVLGLLVYRDVVRRTGSRRWALGAAGLFAFSSDVFGLYSLAKAYAFGTLLMFGAYSVLSTGSRSRWAAAGFMLGLATACRVYLAGVVPAFLFHLYRSEPQRRALWMSVGGFAAAFIVTLLPAAILYLMDAETFAFNIVGNQLIRDRVVLNFTGFSWWEDKTLFLRMVLGMHAGLPHTTHQLAVLLLACVAGAISTLRARQPVPLASLIALCLFAASHVPTPMYTQYFCMLVPFVLVDAAAFMARVVRESGSPRVRHVLAVGAVIYLLAAPFEAYRYTVSAEYIEGQDKTTDWKIPTIRAVGASIDRHVRPERPVALSFWPGYFLETRATILPGMENHFSLHFASALTPQQAAQFRLIPVTQLLSHLRAGAVDVVALGNRTPDRRALREELRRSGFVMTETIASAEIYSRPRP